MKKLCTLLFICGTLSIPSTSFADGSDDSGDEGEMICHSNSSSEYICVILG